jgi:hypothetical protein
VWAEHSATFCLVSRRESASIPYTPYSRVILEKLMVTQLVKKFPPVLESKRSLSYSQEPTDWDCVYNFVVCCFLLWEVVRPRPTPKLEDHPLLAVRYCCYSTYKATSMWPSCEISGCTVQWWTTQLKNKSNFIVAFVYFIHCLGFSKITKFRMLVLLPSSGKRTRA